MTRRYGDLASARRHMRSRRTDIYEFSYTAKDPAVNGIGFAAVPTSTPFCATRRAGRAGTADPLAGESRVSTLRCGRSPAECWNDFRTLGFK